MMLPFGLLSLEPHKVVWMDLALVLAVAQVLRQTYCIM